MVSRTRRLCAFGLLYGIAGLTARATEPRRDGFAPAAKAASASYFTTGVLDFESRVWAHAQLERVYYAHRIWPTGNAGVKPAFERVISRQLIERKVLESLRASAVLESHWGIPITPRMLQDELRRMTEQSRDPAMLRELFAVLHDDPFLAAEVLARQTLANRLVRRQFEDDVSLHADSRNRAEFAVARSSAGADFETLDGERLREAYRLGAEDPGREPGNVTYLSPDEFTARVAESPRARETRLTGEPGGWRIERTVLSDADELVVEVIRQPKRSFEAWLRTMAPRDDALRAIASPRRAHRLPAANAASPGACEYWDEQMKIDQVPVPRTGHVAVWTGAEMIIWGGTVIIGLTTVPTNSGARYNPATDSWLSTDTGTGVPSPGPGYVAVWNGTEMLVWGPQSIGGRYDPDSDAWKVIPTGPNAPSPRSGATAVWTGSQMIVWGGSPGTGIYTNTGGLYSPQTDSWLPTSTAPGVPGERTSHSAIWTGREMIVWGGSTAVYTNSGGRYDPATDTWAATSQFANVPSIRGRHSAVWTGSEMIVWGGTNGSGSLNDGGRYDPAGDVWSPLAAVSDTPSVRHSHLAFWTGTEMVVWGGSTGAALDNTGGRYDPVGNTWRATSTGANAPASGYFMNRGVWTGEEMIIWDQNTANHVGAKYVLATNSWIRMDGTRSVSRARSDFTAVWTGAELIVWGGNHQNTGDRYDPALAAWTPTSTSSAALPQGRSFHTAVWTGTEMVVWGGFNGATTLYTGGRYSPLSDGWLSTSTASGVPVPRQYHTAVWTGSRMIIWGGNNGGYLQSGALYDPVGDNWTSTSSGVNAPTARAGHTAVWSGAEMIVWGGYDSGPVYLSTGARYDPLSNIWLPTLGSPPTGRSAHTAIWAAGKMVVWGGWSGGYLQTGSRYDPALGSWSSTTTSDAPAGRQNHGAISTGSRMIVWGGAGGSGSLATGGVYDPVLDAWTPTATANAPLGRSKPAAAWTGGGMLVWGGVLPNTNSGGYYRMGQPASPGGSLRLTPGAMPSLAWASVPGATGYAVKRCDPGSTPCIPVTTVANPTINSYADPPDSSSHFYTVEAVNTCGATP